MIEIYDLNGYKQNIKTYGGTDGVKIGITIGEADYLVKYPQKLKHINMENAEIRYSNSPVCEYIGCRIYQSIGLPTQEVWLGIRNDKTVVMCRDFLGRGDILVPFKDIRATFEPSFIDPQGDITNGTGTNLNDILRTLKEHPLSVSVPELRERFWNMFIIDSMIGSPDRDNDNWGLIRDIDGQCRVAPVFDCGNCLNCEFSERQMMEYLNDPHKLEEIAIQRPCIFEWAANKRINPYQYIHKMTNSDCNEAVKRIVPCINMNEIKGIINDIPDFILNDTAKQFYQNLIGFRYERVLVPTYEKLHDLELDAKGHADLEEDLER